MLHPTFWTWTFCPNNLVQDVLPPDLLDLDFSHPGRFASELFGPGRFAPRHSTTNVLDLSVSPPDIPEHLFQTRTFHPRTFLPGCFAPGLFTPGHFGTGHFAPGLFCFGSRHFGTGRFGHFGPKFVEPWVLKHFIYILTSSIYPDDVIKRVKVSSIAKSASDQTFSFILQNIALKIYLQQEV